MDQPDLDFARHQHALAGLARLNRLSNSTGILWRPIRHMARQLDRPLRILDLATGGGDIPLGIWHRARRDGLTLEIHGVDVSPRAVEIAQARADGVAAAVRFSRLNALDEELPGDFDVIMCSLFFHHLSDEQAVALLAKMAAAARHGVLVNDLVRCRRGLVLAHLAARLLTRSPVVWTDAPRSVSAAFTLGEMRGLAESAGLRDAVVLPRWPCRMLLDWRRLGRTAPAL